MQVPRRGDPAVAALAAAQHGVVSRAQLTACGLGRGAIAHRVSRGRLHRIHRGVYLVGHAAEPPLAREVAALLACGPGAVLSHWTAAALWGLVREPPTRSLAVGREVDVTVSGRDCGVRPGVRVHRTRDLGSAKVTHRNGLPVTGPARTLVDLGDGADAATLQRAIEEALVQRVTGERELLAAASAAPSRRGAARVARIVREAAEPALTRSEAERRLLALIEAGGLPRPETNVRIAGYEVDAVWRSGGLVAGSIPPAADARRRHTATLRRTRRGVRVA